MTLVEKVAEMIGVLTERDEASKQMARKILQAILSDPSIVEIEVGAKLPVVYTLANSDSSLNEEFALGAKKQRDAIREAGWVKEKGG